MWQTMELEPVQPRKLLLGRRASVVKAHLAAIVGELQDQPVILMLPALTLANAARYTVSCDWSPQKASVDGPVWMVREEVMV